MHNPFTEYMNQAIKCSSYNQPTKQIKCSYDFAEYNNYTFSYFVRTSVDSAERCWNLLSE